jgi:hypothetical protein
MPKQVKHTKRPSDVNEIAHQLVEMTTQMIPDTPAIPAAVSDYMASIGSRGGKIGGKRRLKTMTKAARSKIASKAAKVRWGKERKRAPND